MNESCDLCDKRFLYDDVRYKMYANLIVSRLGKVTWEFTVCKKCAETSLRGFSKSPIPEVDMDA